jgi:protein gp37
MAHTSKIEWCHSTHNEWIGCNPISPGCDGCYAAVSTPARTMKIIWGPKEERHRTSESNRKLPLRWEKAHEEFFAQHGCRRRVFCSSLSDVFDNAVPTFWRAELFATIRATPHLDWLLLTKRIGNVKSMVDTEGELPENVWLGATIVNQEEADRDIPKLLAVPAAKRFLSMEPLLGPVDLTRVVYPAWKQTDENFPYVAYDTLRGHMIGPDDVGLPKVDWVIAGGESGPNARPMHPDWARSLRDQCQAAGVPFLFKQWGEWLPAMQDGNPAAVVLEINASNNPIKVGKKAAGRLLDGVSHDGFPS